jgi:hypothetical protein
MKTKSGRLGLPKKGVDAFMPRKKAWSRLPITPPTSPEKQSE